MQGNDLSSCFCILRSKYNSNSALNYSYSRNACIFLKEGEWRSPCVTPQTMSTQSFFKRRVWFKSRGNCNITATHSPFPFHHGGGKCDRALEHEVGCWSGSRGDEVFATQPPTYTTLDFKDDCFPLASPPHTPLASGLITLTSTGSKVIDAPPALKKLARP